MEAVAPVSGVTRVVLTGSESTGKTTLAARLARHFEAAFVPEYSRELAARKKTPVEFGDLRDIVRGQIALEDAAGAANTLVVQDTDVLSTVIYANHYFGACPEWIVETSVARKPNLYLLCDIDLPWVADGIRDRGDRRGELQELFRIAILSSDVPAVVISGIDDTRFRAAVDAIDLLLLRL